MRANRTVQVTARVLAALVAPAILALGLGTASALPATGPAPAAAEPAAWAGAEDVAPHEPDPAALAELEEIASRTVVVLRDTPDGPEIDTATLPEPAMARGVALAAAGQPGVLAAEVDSVVTALGAPGHPSAQWGLTRLRAGQVWSRGHDASGQVIAVLDTGVDASHPDLAPVTGAGMDVFDANGDGRTDPHGHGTHVAGIAAAVVDDGFGVSGLAWKAEILPVRVLDHNGTGSVSGVTEGILWATANGATVINLSLSSHSASSVERQAIQQAVAAGIVVVAAAGNDGPSSTASYPAAYPETIAVAATTPTDTRASFSTVASYVTLAAPGTNIWSTIPGGGWSPEHGTSMAAPFVAGAAALVLADDPARTPAAVSTALTSTAIDLGPAGKDSQFGHGLIDPVAALGGPPWAPTTTTTTTVAPTTTTTTTTTTTRPPTTAPAPAPVAATSFSDVASGLYYSEAVAWLSGRRITTGCAPTLYCPGDPVTRGQMATFIWRYAGSPPAPANRFTDVPSGLYYTDAVSWLAARGITTGCTTTTYCPDDPVTRGQMATFIWRYAGSPPAPANRFTDVPAGAFYTDAVSWLAARGITTGCTTTQYCPEDPVTRGQMATFLHRHHLRG